MTEFEKSSEFDQTFKTIKKLRHPKEGCPWDLAHTKKSLLPYLIEESFEYKESVLSGDIASMKDELGDVLLQVILHSVIAEQENEFSFNEVVKSLREKVIRRHPHVFNRKEGEKRPSIEEIEEEYKKIKKTENKNKKKYFFNEKLMANTALRASQKIGRLSSQINFDWESPEQVSYKVEEEWQELKEEIVNSKRVLNIKRIEEELGDLLFSVTQLARHYGIDAEETLRKSNQKFIRRFNKVEELLEKPLKENSQEELEKFWGQVKVDEKENPSQ